MSLNYVDSVSPDILPLIESWKNNDVVIIFGNGVGINKIPNDVFQLINKKDNIFTLGLKRIYLKYYTDIIMYGDNYIENEYYTNQVDSSRSQLVKLSKKFAKNHIIDWVKNKTFNSIPSKGIWHYRNSLIGAFHLCHLLGIKKVILTGVDFNDRSYFFGRHPNYPDNKQPYEIRPPLKFNYSLYHIVQESIDDLHKSGIEVFYTDKSKLLKEIKGIQKISWDTIIQEHLS
jgi:hypothetical protein